MKTKIETVSLFVYHKEKNVPFCFLPHIDK